MCWKIQNNQGSQMYSSDPRAPRQEAGDGSSLPQLQFHSIYFTLQLHGEFLIKPFILEKPEPYQTEMVVMIYTCCCSEGPPQHGQVHAWQSACWTLQQSHLEAGSPLSRGSNLRGINWLPCLVSDPSWNFSFCMVLFSLAEALIFHGPASSLHYLSSPLSHTHACMHTAFLWTCIFGPSNLVSSSVGVLPENRSWRRSTPPSVAIVWPNPVHIF